MPTTSVVPPLPQHKTGRPAYDLTQRPSMVIWEITRACDLACTHCRAAARAGRNPLELSSDEGRELIDQVAAFGPPPPLFMITGGDPMRRPDIAELVAYAARRKLPVTLSASPTPLLTNEAIREFKAAGLVAIALGVDGSTARAHDAFRGVDGLFARTMEAWDTARQCRLKIQINSMVTRANLLELPGIANLVRSRGALSWSVFFLVPLGRGSPLEPLSPAECEDVMHFLYDVATVLPVKVTEGHHYKRIAVERMLVERGRVSPEAVLPRGPIYRALRDALGWELGPHRRRAPTDINAGRGFLFVSHVGTVHPSGFLPVAAGNVRFQRLADIYRNSPLFVTLRDPRQLTGRCAGCEFVRICGGSRSRAYAASEDPCAEDPLCPYQPGSFPLQDELAQLMGGQSRRRHTDNGHPARPGG